MEKKKEKIYHCTHSCNYCGGSNKVTRIVDSEDGHVNECETECQESVCGALDYWAYGYYESSQSIEGFCEKY